jgi:hypothetical protein
MRVQGATPLHGEPYSTPTALSIRSSVTGTLCTALPHLRRDARLTLRLTRHQVSEGETAMARLDVRRGAAPHPRRPVALLRAGLRRPRAAHARRHHGRHLLLRGLDQPDVRGALRAGLRPPAAAALHVHRLLPAGPARVHLLRPAGRRLPVAGAQPRRRPPVVVRAPTAPSPSPSTSPRRLLQGATPQCR